MRISIEEPLARPAEIFTVAAALVVLFSSGGDWIDAGAPLDRVALAELIESLDRSHGFPGPAGAPPTVEDTEGMIALASGSIRWDEERIELELDDVDFTAHVRAHIRGGLTIADRDESFCVIKAHGHPHRFLYRIGTFFGGPVIRHYIRREAAKRGAAFRDLVASMPTVREPLHRSDEWTFVRDRTATPSSILREPGPMRP